MTDKIGAEQAAYWKGAYERMASRNIEMSNANEQMRVAISELLDANSYYFPIGNPWGDKARNAVLVASKASS